MAIINSVGTLVAVVQAEPATKDQAGFEALSFTPAGCMSAIPPLTGTKEIASFDCLDTGEEIKVLDMDRAGQGDIEFAYNEDDAGQVIIETAAAASTHATSVLSLRFTLSNGTIYYRTGLATSYSPNSAVGQVIQATASMEFFGTHVKVPA